MKKILLTCLLVLSMLTGCSDEKDVTDKEIAVKIQDVEYAGKYTGTLIKGIPNGEATFIFDDGTTSIKYEGNFENGELKGPGKLEANNYVVTLTSFEDVVNRVGQFKGDTLDGIASGHGEFYTATDDGYKYSYIGDFANGTFNGQGKKEFEDKSFSSTIIEGTWVDGTFTPTTQEFIVMLSTSDLAPFPIPEKSNTFLSEHADFFPAQSFEQIQDYIDLAIEPKHLDKSHSSFGDKLVKIDNIRIHQAQFYEDAYLPYTLLLGSNNFGNFTYFIYCIGNVDVYAQDTITLYALPLGKGSYTSTLNSSVPASMLLASFIELK